MEGGLKNFRFGRGVADFLGGGGLIFAEGI